MDADRNSRKSPRHTTCFACHRAHLNWVFDGVRSEWLERVEVLALFIEPGSPWENGYIESFNGNLRDELLALEWFDTLLEAKVLIERWRQHFNTVRPHSSLGYVLPAPETNRAGLKATSTLT